MNFSYEGKEKLDQAVCKKRKSLSVSFGCLFSAKSLTISEKLNRGFSREFLKIRNPELIVRNLQCKVLIKGFSIGEDLGGKTSSKLHDIQRDFEKHTGLHLTGIDARYEQVNEAKNEMPSWSFDFTFYEVDPSDPFTGTAGWEFYK